MMNIKTTTSVEFENNTGRNYLAVTALLGAGLLLGVITNLAKVAHGIGISPLAYLIWSLTGATLLLAIVTYARGQIPKLTHRSLEYFIVAGFLSAAVSNLIFFNAIPRLGVSFIALMFSLPPLMTYAGALMLRMERFCWWRASGVLLALTGAAFLVLDYWAAPNTDHFWIVLTLLGPVMLSAGNLYRTLRWPPGATAESLAPGMLAGAVGILILFALVFDRSLSVPTQNTYVVPLIAIQAVLIASQSLLLFVLQKVGGPVFLSLMGGVSAVFGVPIAMFLLAEPVLSAFAPSAMLITAGIVAMLLGVKKCRQSSLQPRTARGK